MNSASGLKTGTINTTPNLDSMYFKKSSELDTYWIASSSSHNSSYMLYVNQYGGIGSTSNSFKLFGFRPVVCLKSDVYLLENTELENTYTLNID